MPEPVMFADRSRNAQIVLGGLVPAALGALAGVLVGASAPAYWVVAALAGVGGFLSGFEHPDGWDAADRGFFGGAFYGTLLLIVHGLIGNHPRVSLGSFPPALAVITTLAGTLLAAAGGRIARTRRSAPATLFDEPA
jgi:ABC-type Na+ efflux pump permease subunit